MVTEGAPTGPVEVPKLRILEALSATGLRSIRYWKEIDGLETILANDCLDAAVATIKQNVEFNDISVDSQVQPSLADATSVPFCHAQ